MEDVTALWQHPELICHLELVHADATLRELLQLLSDLLVWCLEYVIYEVEEAAFVIILLCLFLIFVLICLFFI